MKVQSEDLIPLILDFISTYYGDEALKQFQKFFHFEKVDYSKDPLVKAGGLQEILMSYLKSNKEVLKSFKAHLTKSKSSKKE